MTAMTRYLTMADVLFLHQVLIDRYGGPSGIRDAGALEAALYRPQSGYYKDIIQQAAALLESLAINHPFLDGNKRVAIAAMDTFLRLNNCRLVAQPDEIYDFMMLLFDENSFQISNLVPWLDQHIHQLS